MSFHLQKTLSERLASPAAVKRLLVRDGRRVHSRPFLPESYAHFEQQRGTRQFTLAQRFAITAKAKAKAQAQAKEQAKAEANAQAQASSKEAPGDIQPIDHTTAFERLASLREWEARAFPDEPQRPSDQPPSPPDEPPEASPTSGYSLTYEQQAVIKLVIEDKRNVFFTGSAGTGKSHLLRALIDALKDEYPEDPNNVYVTASTGLAAFHISGTTLHSFAGLGITQMDINHIVDRIKRNKEVRTRWKKAKVLVIDEISMIDASVFDTIEHIARQIRRSKKPFGGIQIVATGDFFQLPPVSKDRTAAFCFEAAAWEHMHWEISLTKVFRQKDPAFAAMLNEIRAGHVSQDTFSTLRRLNRPLHLPNGLEATELYPLRAQADRANQVKMAQLEGPEYTYTAGDEGEADPPVREKLLKDCIAPPVVRLKKGAQVMVTKNLKNGLHNGAVGKVKYFESPRIGTEPYPVVEITHPDGDTMIWHCHDEAWTVEALVPSPTDGAVEVKVLASRTQIPLVPAWALTIHKAQGQTLQHVRVNLANVFEKGQAYVALSRATTMDGLQVVNFFAHKIAAHEKVQAFYRRLATAPKTTAPPRRRRKRVDGEKEVERPARGRRTKEMVEATGG